MKPIVWLFVLLCLAVSANAQDTTLTPIPSQEASTPLASETPLPTEAALPTQTPAPTETLLAAETPSPTVEAVTSTPTASATSEGTASPVIEITPTITTSATVTPQSTASDGLPGSAAPLPLLYSTDFESGWAAAFSDKTGWTDVPTGSGQALQSSANAVPVWYTAAVLEDSAVEARFLHNSGEGQLLLRGYSVGLSADGTLTLYRDQVALATSQAAVTPNVWTRLRLNMIGAELQVSVDGLLMLSYTDAAPLPAGQAGFAASQDAVLRVDDFAVFGVPVDTIPTVTADAKTPLPTLTPEANMPLPMLTATQSSPVCPAAGALAGAPLNDGGQEGSLSPDGRYVVYWSNTDEENKLYDRLTCTVTSLNAVERAGLYNPLPVRISADNNYVYYPGTSALYRTNRTTGMQETVVADPEEHYDAITLFDMSADGRYVVFTSFVPLLPGQTDSAHDVYLRDMTTNGIERISVDSNEQPLYLNQSMPNVTYSLSVSDDGRYVIFSGNATLPGFPGTQNNACELDGQDNDFNENCYDVFVRDRQTGTTFPANVDNNGTVAPLGIDSSTTPDGTDSNKIAISGSGRYVFFGTRSPLVPQDTDSAYDVYRRDLQLNVTELISVRDDETNASGSAYLGNLSVSDDGNIIVFGAMGNMSSATSNPYNVGDTTWNLWARRVSTGQTVPILTDNGTPISAWAWTVSLSANGRQMYFTRGTGLTSATGCCFYHAVVTFAGDPAPATPTPTLTPTNTPTPWPSVGPLNVQATLDTTTNSLTLTWSGDAGVEYFVFRSSASAAFSSSIGRSTTNTLTISNVPCGQTVRYYVARDFFMSSNNNGNYVEVTSPPCVPRCDANAAIQRISVGTNNVYQTIGANNFPGNLGNQTSTTGRYIVFTSRSPMVSGEAQDLALERASKEMISDAYWHDRQTCTTRKLSFDETGGEIGLYADAVAITSDGMKALFMADNSDGNFYPYIHNLATGTTWRGPRGAAFNMSADGRYLLMIMGPEPIPGVVDTNNIRDMVVYDTLTQSISVVSMKPDNSETLPAEQPPSQAALDILGQIFTANDKVYAVAYGTNPQFVANDTNNTSDVFLRNVTDGVTTRLSVTDDELQLSGSSQMLSAAVVGTTLYVPFRYYAGFGVAQPFTLYLRTVDLSNPALGTTTIIGRASGEAGAVSNGFSGIPYISANGRWVVFESTATNLDPNDTTIDSDIFVRDLVTHTTALVSGTIDSTTRNLLATNISDDGSTILFETSIPTVVTGDTNGSDTHTGNDVFTIANPLYVASEPPPPTPQPVLIAPADSSLIVTTGAATSANIAFRWTYDTAAAVNYIVQVDTDPQFASVDQTCTTTTLTCTIPGVGYGTYHWRVLVNEQSFSESATFKVSPPAPRAPVLVSPANGRTLLPNERPTVTLSWSWGTVAAPAGAPFTYALQVATDATFNTPLVSVDGLTSASYTTAALADGRFFWRVRAINSAGLPGAWSLPFSFVVDSQPPAAPAIIYPAENGIYNTTRPPLSWSPVPGAVRYGVVIVPSAGVCSDSNPRYRKLDITTPQLIVPVSLPQDMLKLCVTAYDAAGNASPQSVRSFAIFIGLSPANNALIAPTTRPVFTWTAAPALGVTYRVQVDTDMAFNPPYSYESVPLTVTTHTVPTPLNAGVYYWRVVRRVGGVDDTVVTPVSRKLVVAVPTSGPVLNTPAAPINAPMSLTWAAASAPVGLTITDYEVVLSRSTTFVPPLASALVSASSPLSYSFVPAANLNRVAHYWRVRGLNGRTPVTQWSSGVFIVDNVAPANPTITVPTEKALVNTVQPRLTWLPVLTASRYRIRVQDAATAADIIPEQEITTPFLVPTITLPQTDLLLRVQAGDGTNWSSGTLRTFSVRLGTLPAHNGIVTTPRPTFTWTAVPGATSYELQIDSDPHFEGGAGDGLILRTVPLGSVLSYTLSEAEKLPARGRYYWRVKANNLPYPTNRNSRTLIYAVLNAAPTNLQSFASGSATPDRLLNAQEVNPSFSLAWTQLTPAPLFYEVQISTSAAFPTANTQLLTAAAGEPKVIAGSSLNDGVYYWRVRAVYNLDVTTVSPWSLTAAFRLDKTAPLPPLSAVPQVSRFNTLTPRLSWAASATAVRYRLTLIDNTTGQPLTGYNRLPVSTPFYVVPLAAGLWQRTQTTYSWSVEAEDDAGNISSGFMPRQFSLFIGAAPAAAQFVADTTPLFTWTPHRTGAVLWLQIASDAAMTNLVRNYQTLTPTLTQFMLPAADALPEGRYFWRVISSVQPDAANVWGQPFYVVNTLASITPTPLTPPRSDLINAAELSAGLTFSWTAVNPSVPVLTPPRYRVEIARDATFAPAQIVGVRDVPATSTVWTGLNLTNGVYYWRVRGLFGTLNDRGPASAPFTFTVDQTAPLTPALVTPQAESVITTTRRPAFGWLAAGGAPTQYTLEIGPDVSFNEGVVTATVNVPLTSYTLTAAQSLSNGVYYWRLKTRDAAGNISTSAARRLTIAMP